MTTELISHLYNDLSLSTNLEQSELSMLDGLSDYR